MPELIDRQAALKKMCETCGYCEKLENAIRSTHPDFVTDKCNMYRFIAELPAIEPKRGRWEDIPGMENTVFCSECLAAANKELSKKYKGCPFCLAVMDGANMRGGADDAEAKP